MQVVAYINIMANVVEVDSLRSTIKDGTNAVEDMQSEDERHKYEEGHDLEFYYDNDGHSWKGQIREGHTQEVPDGEGHTQEGSTGDDPVEGSYAENTDTLGVEGQFLEEARIDEQIEEEEAYPEVGEGLLGVDTEEKQIEGEETGEGEKIAECEEQVAGEEQGEGGKQGESEEQGEGGEEEQYEDALAGDGQGHREEEEFGDEEDQQLRKVTEDDENANIMDEDEELSEQLQRNFSQEESYKIQKEEETNDTIQKRESHNCNEDNERQVSPVISMTPPHSYRLDGSGQKLLIEYGGEQNEEEEEKEEEEEEERDFEMEQFKIKREELVEKYHQALSERHQMQEQNYQLQHKLAEHFRRKKSDDSRIDERNMTDQEQRYLKSMAMLDELRQEERRKNEFYRAELEELKMRCAEKQEQVDRERLELMEYKKQIALSAINSRTGKTIPHKDLEQYLNAESKKESEVVAVRLENIKLKNRLRKKEAALKSKEELAEGLHLIDFEQLKIENQTYNEKIEERNEELMKLRRKITNTVQVLTHLKEKLQFVQNENQAKKAHLYEIEEIVGKRRDNLSRLKQARDALRFDNQNIQVKGGLLGNKALLRDFEDRKDESDELKQKLSQLKMRHAELTLSLNGVRRKIEDSKLR